LSAQPDRTNVNDEVKHDDLVLRQQPELLDDAATRPRTGRPSPFRLRHCAGRRAGRIALTDTHVNSYDNRWRDGKPVAAGTKLSDSVARLNRFDEPGSTQHCQRPMRPVLAHAKRGGERSH
jgi:hypothetical protein